MRLERRESPRGKERCGFRNGKAGEARITSVESSSAKIYAECIRDVAVKGLGCVTGTIAVDVDDT